MYNRETMLDSLKHPIRKWQLVLALIGLALAVAACWS